ncbi:hypothetical protein C4D60_Mb06t01250 [Musa balbisiana]|uniref:Uncharacterized protein n=1 Tax=Musa balbisiana TaxID=52838 RepID=A0A4S8IJU1_MUSBA|nr:hypothetical protein C4D60_Mb06t01250 [Musa balbisiana]
MPAPRLHQVRILRPGAAATGRWARDQNDTCLPLLSLQLSVVTAFRLTTLISPELRLGFGDLIQVQLDGVSWWQYPPMTAGNHGAMAGNAVSGDGGGSSAGRRQNKSSSTRPPFALLLLLDGSIVEGCCEWEPFGRQPPPMPSCSQPSYLLPRSTFEVAMASASLLILSSSSSSASLLGLSTIRADACSCSG